MVPTPPTAEQLQLISDYEPALFFYRGPQSPGAERFFPSDAKRYLERAALYRANAPFTKADWGAPVIATGQIAATEGGAGVFLGKKDTSATPQYPFLEAGPGQELILDVSGLKPGNAYADLDALARLYAGELKDSQYWYHAEAFDKARLQDLFDRLGHGNFSDLFNPRPGATPALIDPTLICYYLFYPGHDESLHGCQDENGNKVPTAVDFGSFAGEWSCIAVLLDRAGPGNPWAPKWVGLSNRNLGKTLVGDEEVRATMRVLPWSAMDLYGSTHPRFNVSLGSHGLYVAGETLPPLGFDDLGASFCGGAAPFVPPGDEYSTHPFGPYLVWMKFLAGNAIGGLGGPIGGLLGGAAGAAWGIAELSKATWRTHISAGLPNMPGADNVSNTGLVIHPKGLIPPGVAPTNAVEWKSDAVDRLKQPLWGADVSEAPGFTGRWGAHVEQDLQTRRSGMAFPQFWRLFFDSLVRNDPPARHIELTSGTTWTVPADWNNANNTIELIGGGGGGSAGEFPGKSGAGGGGGAYVRNSNVILTPSATISIAIGAAGAGGPTAGAAGAAGGDTIFNNGAMIAKGGGGGVTGATPTGGTGGSTDASVGDSKFAGGNGGGSDPGPNGAAGGGGGGGAGGPNGKGANGGNALFDGLTPGGGAGGGGNGGGSTGLGISGTTKGGDGGNNSALAGSGAGSTDAATAGKDGSLGGGGGGGFSSSGTVTTRGGDGGDGIDMNPVGGGGGGGGGGSGGGSFDGSGGGEGGNYGGGGGGGGRRGGAGGVNSGLGGNGAAGVIKIIYTPDF